MRQANTSSARGRLLRATEDMLRETGMCGMGMKDVVRRSRAPIGSLYYYFPEGKEQLVAESLAIHADRSRRLLERFFDGKSPAATAVLSLFNTAAEGFEQAGGHKGCALGAVTLDLMPQDGAIREICKLAFDDWAAIIAPQLPFRDAHTRREFAMTVIAAVEGAFVLAKAAQSGDPLRAAGASLASMLGQSSSPRRRRQPRRMARRRS